MVPYARPAGFAIDTAQNLETPFLDEIITYDDSTEPNLQIFRHAAMRSGPIKNPRHQPADFVDDDGILSSSQPDSDCLTEPN